MHEMQPFVINDPVVCESVCRAGNYSADGVRNAAITILL